MRLFKTMELAGLMTLVSCTDKPKTNNNDIEQAITNNSNQIVVEDSYAAEPLEAGQNFINDYSNFKVEKTPIKNNYIEGQVDTLFTLIDNFDTLQIYKAPTN